MYEREIQLPRGGDKKPMGSFLISTLIIVQTAASTDWLSDFFNTVHPDQLGLAGIVSLVIISIIKGWLTPRGAVKDRMADKDAQIAALAKERDDWKTAFMRSEEGRTVLTKQNSDLIDGAETTNRLIESLRNRIEQTPTIRQIGG